MEVDGMAGLGSTIFLCEPCGRVALTIVREGQRCSSHDRKGKNSSWAPATERDRTRPSKSGGGEPLDGDHRQPVRGLLFHGQAHRRESQ